VHADGFVSELKSREDAAKAAVKYDRLRWHRGTKSDRLDSPYQQRRPNQGRGQPQGRGPQARRPPAGVALSSGQACRRMPRAARKPPGPGRTCRPPPNPSHPEAC
jgi:hypothetical protein